MTKPRRFQRGAALGLLGAGVVAGAIAATAIGASADTGTTSGTGTAAAVAAAASSTPSGAPAGAPPGARAHDHGANPVRSDEKSVSSDVAAKLKAAALKAVPGGTVYRVETDSGDATYEAHMTKSDGTEVTVKFDKNLAVTGVEDGMGK